MAECGRETKGVGMFRNVVISFLGLMLFLLMAGGEPVFSEGKTYDKVSFVMNWLPCIDHAVYAIGLKKGFYKEKNIDLTIEAAKGSELSTKAVAAGTYQFGQASAETILLARSKGMPLKALLVTQQNSPVALFSLKNIRLKSPKDMESKSLASDPSSMKQRQFELFCTLNKVDINKVKVNPIKGSDFVHILNGSSDTILAFSYIGEATLQKAGKQFHELKLSDYGVSMYSLSLITADKVIKDNPDLVRRFVAATVKGWNYAIAHPQETVEALIALYPEMKKEEQLSQISGVLALMQSKDTRAHGVGWQTQEQWESLQNLLYEMKLLESKIDVRDVYTTAFYPKQL